MYKVTLVEYEIRMALTAGVERRLQVILKKMGQQNLVKNTKWEPWDTDIEAAAAEYAAAKGLGLLWDGSYNTFKKADIGDRIQVRHSKGIQNNLVVRDRDNEEEIFVLMVGSIPTFFVVGWIFGYDAMQDKYRKLFEERGLTGPKAYLVPQSDLKPIEELTR